MRKTTRTVLAVTTMCMALAGCGNATAKDTRKLDCVRLGGGLSCDWDHVSGADKEPER